MEKDLQHAATDQRAAFFSLVNHPLKLRLYLLRNLPSAFFAGLKVLRANDSSCAVSVPYKSFTKNPFRSTYFACLSMAAELSTGVLAMANVFGQKPSISMLITGMEAKFYKKAKGVTVFHCQDGEKIRECISISRTTHSSREIKVHTKGTNSNSEVVAEFWFTWSFRVK